MMIAVCGGEGRPGRTFVAVNLAWSALEPVTLLDLDGARPRCSLFLKPAPESAEVVFSPVPRLDPRRCDACGECAAACRHRAILPLKASYLLLPALCSGCGQCLGVCPARAVSLSERRVGIVEKGRAGHVSLVSARLDDRERRFRILDDQVRVLEDGDRVQVAHIDCFDVADIAKALH